MKIVWVTLPILLFILTIFEPPSSPTNKDSSVVYSESFDAASLTPQGRAITEHALAHLVADEGVGGSTALRVDYVGYERGSRRVTVSPRISSAPRYKISFWVRFCDGFDFSRGGKLHGLGPYKPVTGGDMLTPEGWSARLMFRRNGGLQSYVYHQNQAGRFGDTTIADGFAFEPNRYHHLVMQVVLNTPASANNGSVLVWVDSKLLIEHNGLRFRSKETPASEIQRLLFNTFHGGSSPDWAPRHADGSYKTDCAFFDNLELTQNF